MLLSTLWYRGAEPCWKLMKATSYPSFSRYFPSLDAATPYPVLNEGESDAIATFIVEIHARGFKYHDNNIQEGGLQISLNLMSFISLLTSVLAAFMFAGVGCEKSSCSMIASLWINESMFLHIAPFVALSASLRSLIIELLLAVAAAMFAASIPWAIAASSCS